MLLACSVIGSLKLIYAVFKNLFRTTQKTRRISTAETIRLMSAEIIAV
jgi:hypothetical protein